MKIKGIILVACILFAVLTVGIVTASENVTSDALSAIEDDIATDDLEVLESDDLNYLADDGFRPIQDEIDSANPGDTVYLNGSTYYCDYLVSVNKTVTIDGRGSTLKFDGSDKNYTSSFFHINPGANNVVLKNIKFIGGNLFFGGAITWEGDNGSIVNCEFSDNLAKGEYAIGGALLIIGDNCSVLNSTFKNNIAHQFGGAILCNGTGGTIDNCEFINNEATGEEEGQGGALVLTGDNFIVSNSRFINNHCTFMGGAISVMGNRNNKIINCSFDGNYIQNTELTLEDYAGGGAIYSASYGLMIDGCNFTNNYANYTIGGALHLSVNDTVINSFFNKNFALKDQSGYVWGNDIVYLGSINEYNDNIKSNVFVCDFAETEQNAVGVNSKTILDLIIINNIFNKTKLNSTISFSAGIVFDYGTVSSPIQIIVVGGTVEAQNIKVLNHPEAKFILSNNALSVYNLAAGKYTLCVTTTPYEYYEESTGELSVVVNKATAVISASSTEVVLKKSTYWDIKLVDSKSKKAISNMDLSLKVYTGNKFKTVSVKTDSKGVAHFKTSSLGKGKHKIVVVGTHSCYNFNKITSYITVVKPTELKFKVYKRNNDKSGSLISFQVINKKTKKPVSGVNVKFLIKDGKKYKTITLKTKTLKKNGKKIKGIAGFFSNQFSVGKHTVKIQPVSIKYSGSGKSSITIKKSAKSYPPKTTKV